MKEIRSLVHTTVALATLAVGTLAAEIKYQDLPPAVQEAIAAQVGAAKLDRLEQHTRNGRTIYEVSFTPEPQPIELRIAENGTLLDESGSALSTPGTSPGASEVQGSAVISRKPLSGERSVNFEDLPSKVQSSLRRQAGSEEIDDIQRSTVGGKTVYKATFRRNGRQTQVRVGEDGNVLEDHAATAPQNVFRQTLQQLERVEFRELPAAVQRTLRSEAGLAQIRDLQRGTFNGRTIYQAGFEQGESDVYTQIRVSEEGSLFDKISSGTRQSVQLADLPNAARTAIRTQAEEFGEPRKISRIVRDGRSLYEVTFRVRGRDRAVLVSEDGALRDENGRPISSVKDAD